MPQKWNLQDIKPAGAPKAAPRQAPVRQTQSDIAPRPSRQQSAPPEVDPDLASIDIIDGNATKRKRLFVTTVIATGLLIFGFTVNVLLGGATVTVYPKVKEVSVQSEFTGRTVPQAGDLSYELLTLDASAEKQVKAAGKEEVSLQATGKIFVYNNKVGASQRLITNTRFESPDGLIFRIKDSIEVPPATTDAKGNTVPGKISADVYSDGTGEQYNLAPARFTVPGLKGSEQFDLVYAESISPFAGGFEGEKYIIDEAELQTAKQELHIELRNLLLSQMKEKVPTGFILYEGAVTFAFDSLPSTEYGDSLATIKEQARLQVPIFKADDFAKYIAEKSVPDYDNESVYLLDPTTLTFTYSDPLIAQADIKEYTELVFTLKGSTKIVWIFDEEILKTDLLDKPKNEATSVFSAYRSIGHAQAEVKPFWATKFPDTPKEIEVVTVIE